MKTSIAIGLPVYNASARIEKTLKNLDALCADKIIVSDNASTDNTVNLIRQMIVDRKLSTTVLLYRNQINQGSIENFRRCLAFCETDYFMWAADDDTHDDSFLELAEKCLQENQDTVVAYPKTLCLHPPTGAAEQPNNKPIAAYMAGSFDTTGIAGTPAKFTAALNMPHCLAIYGLWKTQALKRLLWFDLEWGFDFVLLAQAALLGDIRQVTSLEGKELFYYQDKPDAQNWEAMIASGKRLDTRKSNRGLTLPIVSKLYACMEAVNLAPIHYVEKYACIQAVRDIAKTKFKDYIDFEILRARKLISQGDYRSWGDDFKTPDNGVASRQIEIDFVKAKALGFTLETL